MKLSISDNDICSTCQHCIYDPGEMSACLKDWPNQEDYFGEDILKCSFYERIDKEFENWANKALNRHIK